MEKIGEPCAASLVVNNVEDGEAFAATDRLSGCTASGIYTGRQRRRYRTQRHENYREILENGLRLSPCR